MNKSIPILILFDLLELVCEPDKKFYIINKTTFKYIQTNHLKTFLEKCSPYYPKTTKYLNVTKYKSFLTVVRQICKSNNIQFHYKIKYIYSSYEIIYYIHKDLEGTFQNEIQP